MLFRSLAALLGLACTAPLFAQDAEPAAAPLKLESTADRASYSIGLNMGRNFKRQQVPINAEAVLQGLRDAISGAKPALTDDEMKAAFQALEQEIAAAQETRNKDLIKKNTEEGAAFLAANKKKPGIKSTASGLQYKVLKEGTGAVPKKTDTVSTHYSGKLLDGTEFDSSYSRNEPATFPVTGVIPGWTEALQLMKVGSKWQLFIPAELAYKDQGAGAEIGPNATLVFEIELLGVEK